MKQLNKLLTILIFSILLLIIGVVIWSFFDPYARVMLVPLGILNIYYFLLFSFIKLKSLQEVRWAKTLGWILIALPLVALALAYDRFIYFSADLINYFISS